MPGTEVTQNASSTPLPRPSGIVESRIDAPHVLGDGPPRAVADPSLDPAQIETAASVETLALVQAQAQQLSGHLQQQARDLDERESRLQAQMAQFENDVRTARLQLAERQQELDEQAASLQTREQAIEQQSQDWATQLADQAELNRRQDDELAARKQQLTAVGRRLVQQRLAHQKATDRLRAARRRFERDMRLERQHIDTRRQASLALARMLLDGVERRRAAVEDQEKQLAQREATLFARCRQQAEELAARMDAMRLSEQRLTVSEELLAAQQAECLALREQLLAQQQQCDTTRRQAETDWEAKRTELELALRQQQQAVERRSEEVDSRRLTLEQLQSEVRQMHRESLEMRLAAEELAAQLAGAAPPASITSSIGRLRARLTDHFRLASADLAEQRQELEQLRQRLAEQHQRLSAQKSDVQQWLERRQEEIEQQAARLVCREQELDWQQQQIQSIQSRWQQERQQYQEEIRKLLSDLRRRDALAA